MFLCLVWWFLSFWRIHIERAIVSFNEENLSRISIFMSWRKWNSFEIPDFKWHCDTARSRVASDGIKIKDRAGALPMVKKKGASVSDVQNVPQAPRLKAWPPWAKSQPKKQFIQYFEYSNGFRGYTVGEKEVRKEFKDFLLFVSCVAASCFDFSPGLIQLSMITLPLGSLRDFVYDQSFFLSFYSLTLIFYDQNKKR